MSYKYSALHLFPETEFFVKDILGDYYSGQYKGKREFFPK